MRIAAYVDIEGRVASFREEGSVRLYDNASGVWEIVGVAPFDAAPGSGLARVKAAVQTLVAQLGDCRVFLSAEVRGVINAILQEEFGFHTWKSQGSLFQQLDTVAEKEVIFSAQKVKEAMEVACAPRSAGGGCCGGGGGGFRPPRRSAPLAAEAIGDGRYRFNLGKVLAEDPNLNARLALIPVMEETPFRSLEILCDHLPRWFAQKLAELNLRAEIETAPNGVRALVFPIPNETTLGQEV